MKKILLSILVVGLCASCGSQKQVQSVAQTPGPSYSRTPLDVPCLEESMDDDDYFREVGTASNTNQQNARSAAFNNAKQMILQRLGGFIQGLATDYSRDVAGQARASKVQRIIEDEFAILVEYELNHAGKTCEKIFIDNQGLFESWIAISIPKQRLIENLIDQLSKEEELEAIFNREEFRKYAEERAKRMKEAQGK